MVIMKPPIDNHMHRRAPLPIPLISLAALCLLTSCRATTRPIQVNASPTTQGGQDSPTNLEDWSGIYSSTAEIRGFTGTVLLLEPSTGHDLSYRMRFYSDAGDRDNDIKHGNCLVEGATLYVPMTSGSTYASVERYTMLTVNGYRVLMRDDAFKLFREQNKLYDYGILIKVAEATANVRPGLQDVEHKSIKSLYGDPSKSWKDPYVNGPNSR